MVETAAHLTDHVLPHLAVRQWVLSVPKRLRHCARPPIAMDRLRKPGAALVYRCAKQHSEPMGDKRVGIVAELVLTPLELIDRIAALGSHRRAPTGTATLACWHQTRHCAPR